MNSKKIRQTFFDFFESKDHKIVPSAPMVNQNDPTLLFTNAGMNQFKDLFLGNQEPDHPRIADTQKCLRVSGKHNDLEEVGLDSYHHTMFEMLGNWSFGDYFKSEAINWAWELLTGVYGIEKDRIYVTIFEGAEEDGVPLDQEANEIWSKLLPVDRVLEFGKKDNFWEMGDTGPCGPCSEIHVDLRSDKERQKQSGAELVNQDHPLVIEIWNLVFIQYQRMEDGNLQPLKQKHVDTGMGFERLCMVLQSKKSNYETDVFMPFISFLEKETGKQYRGKYGEGEMVDTAFRVIVDHLRAVGFAIADGAMPANTGAGYVIRRILRRAVRYYYSFLDRNKPLLFNMVPILSAHFGDTFPELSAQTSFIQNVVKEEEKSFLKTLADGLRKLEQMNLKEGECISGTDAFELYDTFGFPIDLTRLIAQEAGARVDEEGFEIALEEQKTRSRKDAKQTVGDWQELMDHKGVEFVGYDQLELEGCQVVKYRNVKTKKGSEIQLVLDRTPFYAEGGGQVGDTGELIFGDDVVKVLDTQKENELIIQTIDRLPTQIEVPASAKVDKERRKKIENNHSATHLLHAALRSVLGSHVQQKGSLVAPNHLRFDFSHFQKMTDEEILKVEQMVNSKIRENIVRKEDRSLAITEAKEAGAMMLFGEKYGDEVRMITFDPDYSIELCGGCHVPATGQIGHLRITTETSVASGVRRVEAVTAEAADRYLESELNELKAIRDELRNPKSAVRAVQSLQEENKALKKQIEELQQQKASGLKDQLVEQALEGDGFKAIIEKVPVQDSKILKDLAYQLLDKLDSAVIVLAADISGKPQMVIAINKSITESLGFHAGNIIRELASHIKGGGGGQAFFASAGGSDSTGIGAALDKAKGILKL